MERPNPCPIELAQDLFKLQELIHQKQSIDYRIYNSHRPAKNISGHQFKGTDYWMKLRTWILYKRHNSQIVKPGRMTTTPAEETAL